MKKRFLLLLISLILFGSYLFGQNLKNFKGDTLKKDINHLIFPKWENENDFYKIKVAFYGSSDSIIFNKKPITSTDLISALNKELHDKNSIKKVLFELEFYKSISQELVSNSINLIEDGISNNHKSEHYFKFSPILDSEKNYNDSGSFLQINRHKKLKLNKKKIKLSELENHLINSKASLLFIEAYKGLEIRDLSGIIEITNKLQIKSILNF